MHPTLEKFCTEDYIQKAAAIKGRARPYPMCVALGQIYNQISDKNIKLKLRYITTLAILIATKCSELDPVWIRSIYPSYKDYEDYEAEYHNKCSK